MIVLEYGQNRSHVHRIRWEDCAERDEQLERMHPDWRGPNQLREHPSPPYWEKESSPGQSTQLQSAPEVQSAPRAQSAPTQESAPTVQSATTVQSAPTVQSATTVQSASTQESAPTVESAPTL